MRVHKKHRMSARLVPLLLAAIFALSGTVAAQAPLPHSEDLGDCATCHGSDQLLPDGHVPTADMEHETCVACHVPETPLSLHPGLPLDEHHLLSGLTCQTCHENAAAPGPMSTAQCLACHGPLEELAERTTEVSPVNPHWSPHGETFAECSLCHLVHRESEDFCAQCHDFNFTVP